MVYVCLCGLWHCFTNMWHFENRWLFDGFTEPRGWISPGLAKPSRCDLCEQRPGLILSWVVLCQNRWDFFSVQLWFWILQETSFWSNVPVYIYMYVCMYVHICFPTKTGQFPQNCSRCNILTLWRPGLFVCRCPPSGATGWLSWIKSSWSSEVGLSRVYGGYITDHYVSIYP